LQYILLHQAEYIRALYANIAENMKPTSQFVDILATYEQKVYIHNDR